MIVGAKGLLEDRTVQIDVFADELGGDPGRVPIGAQHGRSRFIRPKRASSVNMMRSSPPGSPHGIRKTVFLKAFCAARSRLG